MYRITSSSTVDGSGNYTHEKEEDFFIVLLDLFRNIRLYIASMTGFSGKYPVSQLANLLPLSQ